jgi:hypothetical protein
MPKTNLEKDYILGVCLLGKRSRQCRYLRVRNGEWICGKNTAAGIRHSKQIDELLANGPAEQIVGQGENKQVCSVHAGDNCPGRADEFAHIFSDQEN